MELSENTESNNKCSNQEPNNLSSNQVIKDARLIEVMTMIIPQIRSLTILDWLKIMIMIMEINHDYRYQSKLYNLAQRN